MIVSGYSEMKPFLPAVEMKSASTTIFDDALEVAQDDLVTTIIGTDLEALLEAAKATPDTHAKLRKLCQRVISQQAFLKSIPDLDLVLTDAGFGVVSNEKTTMASKDRVQSLTTNMKAKLDDSKDALVLYLLKTTAYEAWRGTEEFGRISDGLILTYGEFKDAAVLNNITAQSYPKNWSEFLAMNSALNVALMTDVASYISKDYATELIEDIRDKETLLPNEKKVLKLIKIAICAIALGDRKLGLDQTLKAVAIMKANPTDFPTFDVSPESQALYKAPPSPKSPLKTALPSGQRDPPLRWQRPRSGTERNTSRRTAASQEAFWSVSYCQSSCIIDLILM